MTRKTGQRETPASGSSMLLRPEALSLDAIDGSLSAEEVLALVDEETDDPLVRMRGLVRSQFVRYAMTGCAAGLVEILLFEILFFGLGIDVRFANPIAVVVSLIVAFLINSRFSFKKSTNLPRSIALYILLWIFNTSFSTMAIFYLVDFGIPSAIAKLATMIFMSIWNFFIYRRFIFR